ncbi:MAG: SseB family protein, partial [Rhodobacteraceae bacterium]|nr:SseB family protein [Paracoccaceae bacterium]
GFVAKLAKVGLRFDLPQVEKSREHSAPGSDPDNPPKLR